MLYYFSIVILSSLIAGISELIYRINKRTFIKKTGFILSALVTVFVSGARVSVGTDYTIYTNYQFPLVLNGGDPQYVTVEPLYQMIIHIGKWLNNIFGVLGNIEYQWIFVLTAMLIVGFTYLGIYRLTEHYTLAILLFFTSYFFFYGLNVMRDSITIAIFIFAIPYIINKNWKRYFLWCAIATLFHYSAIVFVAAYFTRYFRKVRIWALVLPIASYLFSSFLANYANKFMSVFASYNHYVGSQIFQFNSRSDMIVTMLTLIIFYLFFRDGTKKQVLFFWFQCFATIVAYAGGAIPMAQRIEYYFLFVVIVSIPEILNVKKISKWLRIATVLFLSLLFCYYTYNQFAQGRGGLLPYQNIWGTIYN